MHHFYVFSPITQIKIHFKPYAEFKPQKLEKNKKYLFIFPEKSGDRCQFHFAKTDSSKKLILEKKLEINIKTSTCIGDNPGIRGKRLQTLIEQFYNEHSDKLPDLEELGYYQTGTVEKSFPLLPQEESQLKEDLAQLEQLRIEAKKETDIFPTLRRRKKTSAAFTIDDVNIIQPQMKKASQAHLSGLVFAINLRDKYPHAKNRVDAYLRYELNSLLNSLLLLLREIVKFAKIFPVASIKDILCNLNGYLTNVSENKEFIEIIDNVEKTNIVSEGLSLWTSPPTEKHADNEFNFLSRTKKLHIKTTAPDLKTPEKGLFF